MESSVWGAVMIILKNISYTTNSNEKILDDINLNIKKGEFVVITGKSGSGKTTLLHALNNLVYEDENVQISGDIRLEEDSIYDMLPEVLRKKVGIVFQMPVVFPMSIYKNMSYALSYNGLNSKKDIDEIIEEKLRLAGLYEEVKDKLKKNALKLPDGQKQRFLIWLISQKADILKQ